MAKKTALAVEELPPPPPTMALPTIDDLGELSPPPKTAEPEPAVTPKPPPPHLKLTANLQIVAAGVVVYDAPWDMMVPMGAAPECLLESTSTLESFLDNVTRQARVAFNRYATANAPKKPVVRSSRTRELPLPGSASDAQVLDSDDPETDIALSEMINNMPKAEPEGGTAGEDGDDGPVVPE